MAREFLRKKAVCGNRVIYRVSGSGERNSAEPQAEDLRPNPGQIDSKPDYRQGQSSLKSSGKGSGRRPVAPERAVSDGPGPVLKEGIRYSSGGAVQSALFGGGEKEVSSGFEEMNLERLEREVAGCQACELRRERTNTVFGAGGESSRIVFIGEAPGKQEDLQGLPFVGRAGKLLDKILAAIDLSREEVYITNILKCRPPGNRDPREEEVRACEGYLKRQLELLNPEVICALGRIAGQNLLKTKSALGKLRGKIHYYNDIKTLVTYHPAALLRNPHFKRPAWEDMKILRKMLDRARGRRQ